VYNVSSWLKIKPPTIVDTSGRRNSAPVPVPSASGRPPNSAAMVVMMMGRNRSSKPGKWHLRLLCSVRSASRAKSIIMMAFFFTMPMSRTIPMMR